VHADVPADQHGVADRRAAGRDVDAVGDEPDAGGVDIDAVAAAAVHDLRVAGDEPNVRGPRRGAHGPGDAVEVGQRGALLQDERGRHEQRRRAGHRQVVHGPVDRQVADRAAGEEHRLDHERVRGQRQPGTADGDDGRVAKLGRGRGAEPR
jgi:hypothetical protein